MPCGCNENNEEAAPGCVDPDSGLNICNDKICDERFLHLGQKLSLRLVGIQCDPQGRCLNLLRNYWGNDEEQDDYGCSRLVTINPDGCVTVPTTPTIHLTQHNEGFLSTNRISRIVMMEKATWADPTANANCMTMKSLKGTEEDLILIWDNGADCWVLKDKATAMCKSWASDESVANLRMLGVTSISGTQCPKVFKQKGILHTNASYEMLATALGKGCLWSDGTNLYWLDYTAKGGQYVRANATATGMEFGVPGSGGITLHQPVLNVTGSAGLAAAAAGSTYYFTTGVEGSVSVGVTAGDIIQLQYFFRCQSPHFRMFPYVVSGPAVTSIMQQEPQSETPSIASDYASGAGETLWSADATGTLVISLGFAVFATGGAGNPPNFTGTFRANLAAYTIS